MVCGVYVIYYCVWFVCGTMVNQQSHLYTPVYYCTHLCTTVHSTVHSCVYTNLYTVQVSERRCSTLVVSTRVGAAWSPRLLLCRSPHRPLHRGHPKCPLVDAMLPAVRCTGYEYATSAPTCCCHRHCCCWCGGLGSCWGIGAAHSIWMLVRVFEAVARARSGTCTPVHVYR